MKFCNECQTEKDDSEFLDTSDMSRNNKKVFEYCCLKCSEKLKKDAEEKRKELSEKIQNSDLAFCKYCEKSVPKILMSTTHQCRKCANKKRDEKLKNKERVYIEITERKCCTCKEVKPVSEFNKKSKDPYGFAANCKTCAKDYNVKYRIAHNEELKKKKRDAYMNDPDRLEKGAKRREASREHIREWDREYSKRTRKRKTARDNSYRRRRKERDPFYRAYMNIKATLASYLRKYAKNGKQFKSKEYIDVAALDRIGPRPSKDYELDHIIPLRSFDPNDKEMIKLAHVEQNLRWIPKKDNNKKLDYIYWDLIENNEVLLNVSKILGLTKEDDQKKASLIFPIVDGNFIRRL